MKRLGLTVAMLGTMLGLLSTGCSAAETDTESGSESAVAPSASQADADLERIRGLLRNVGFDPAQDIKVRTLEDTVVMTTRGGASTRSLASLMKTVKDKKYELRCRLVGGLLELTQKNVVVNVSISSTEVNGHCELQNLELTFYTKDPKKPLATFREGNDREPATTGSSPAPRAGTAKRLTSAELSPIVSTWLMLLIRDPDFASKAFQRDGYFMGKDESYTLSP